MSLPKLRQALDKFPRWNPYASETDKRGYVARVFNWKADFEGELEGLEQKHKEQWFLFGEDLKVILDEIDRDIYETPKELFDRFWKLFDFYRKELLGDSQK